MYRLYCLRQKFLPISLREFRPLQSGGQRRLASHLCFLPALEASTSTSICRDRFSEGSSLVRRGSSDPANSPTKGLPTPLGNADSTPPSPPLQGGDGNGLNDRAAERAQHRQSSRTGFTGAVDAGTQSAQGSPLQEHLHRLP